MWFMLIPDSTDCVVNCRKEEIMEKRMNRAWLFFLMVAVIVAAMVVWICMGMSVRDYSGGILI